MTPIPWVEWSADAFARARAERKAVFLHIGATWCHWCHVMDEGTYTHPRVAELLATRFVPIRVDTDRRPDVNERYNHGGWPTACVLDADGQVLAGRLYVPAHELLSLLESMRDAATRWTVQAAPPELRPSTPAAVDSVWTALRKAHDPYHGGFGEMEKFPHAPVWEWVLDRRLRGVDTGTMLEQALAGLATRETFDHEEGGFYRYATQEDWSQPHVEKLLEDHARLLRLYARAGAHRPQVEAALRWTIATLWRDDVEAFAGSQDADEAYSALPKAQRGAPPRVDRTVYAGWNGLMAGTLVRLAATWARPGLLSLARMVGERLVALVDDDGTVTRCEAGVAGLLDDQAGVADGLVALGQATGESRWLALAARVLAWTDDALRCAEGGYFDRRAVGEGLLRVQNRPLPPNAALGEAAWRLGALTGEVRWRRIAEHACSGAMAEADRWGFLAAPAASLRERLDRRTVVVKVNADGALLDVALAHPHPDVLGLRVHDGVAEGRAMACTPDACARPVGEIDALQASIRQFLDA